MNWVIDIVHGTSQMGTHLDGLNHIQIGNRFYNGHTMDELVENHGTNKLGMETVPQIITRGVLVDVAALNDVDCLDPRCVITITDVEAALDRQSVAFGRGDALFFHTDWGDLWMQDNPRYLSGEPGPGMELALWLVNQGIVLSGCDTWSYGPVPPENPRQPFVVPQTLDVKHVVCSFSKIYTLQIWHGTMCTSTCLLCPTRKCGVQLAHGLLHWQLSKLLVVQPSIEEARLNYGNRRTLRKYCHLD